MKIIKSALLGFKKLDDSDPDLLLSQLREVLHQHQEILINRLMSDLPTYLYYRFQLKVTTGEIDEIREKLVYLKNKNVNMETFKEVVNQVQTKPTTHLTNELFYSEIDSLLKLFVKDTVPGLLLSSMKDVEN
ncbi:hypothetical protein BH10BAC4_BH10BAC4_15120 [soil metagenome]